MVDQHEDTVVSMPDEGNDVTVRSPPSTKHSFAIKKVESAMA